ncbi:MAG: App1 family protein [Alphaproteobacteria bacterium]|nr:App1 family protein [Alphaproteobacteria bacterium]
MRSSHPILLFLGILMLIDVAAFASPIKSDEEIVFFPTAARLSPDNRQWILPIRAWVFEPEHDSLWRRATLSVLTLALGLDDGAADNEIFRKRARWFLVDNERGKSFKLTIWKDRALGPSQPNGHLQGDITLQRRGPGAEPGSFWLRYAAVLPPGDTRLFRGEALFPGSAGLSVISDIDDTIKISNVTDKEALLANTFLKPFEATPGTPAAYRRLAATGAVFHYVSSSPWQLYPSLRAFMDASGFPVGSFHLKDFRVKDSTFFNMFTSSTKSKPPVIEALLAAYPNRLFILIGDSGEQDPEIYGAIARRHPDRIRHIYIRTVTPETARDARYRNAFAGLPAARWTLFRNGAEIAP